MWFRRTEIVSEYRIRDSVTRVIRDWTLFLKWFQNMTTIEFGMTAQQELTNQPSDAYKVVKLSVIVSFSRHLMSKNNNFPFSVPALIMFSLKLIDVTPLHTNENETWNTVIFFDLHLNMQDNFNYPNENASCQWIYMWIGDRFVDRGMLCRVSIRRQSNVCRGERKGTNYRFHRVIPHCFSER